MNRKPSIHPAPTSILVESLEARIAPAGLLIESKFTAVTLGSPVLLDASGGSNDFQGLSTGFGVASGTYLLYLTTGKALVYTSDLNGDGKFEPGEITGISLGTDSQGRPANLILFSDVHGDIATNLLPGHGVSALTDSDNNPNNGRDGRVLLNTDIGSIQLRTVSAADIDSSIPGNTVNSRLGLTSFSIYGNIYSGGNFGGLSIDASGSGNLAAKFSGATGIERYVPATPQIGSIITGSAASGVSFHFTQNATSNVEGPFQSFGESPGQHGGDISNISSVNAATIFSIGTLQTGSGGAGARGGNISNVTLNGVTGSYELIAGDGGAGAVGGQGGSIINFNDLGSTTGQVIIHTGAGGTGTLDTGGAGGTATFATTRIAANVELFLGNGGDGFSGGGNGAGLANIAFTTPEPTLPVGSKFLGTWHDLGDVGNTHPIGTAANPDGTVRTVYSPEAIDFNGDGFGDGVFTTTTPNQVVIEFGDGRGGLVDNGGSFNLTGAETVYLRVPGLVNPTVTVGDFNGDGRPDVAVASSSANNFAGVYVFLDQIGTPLDPVNTHNFSGNPVGDHPFSEAQQSALPSLGTFTAVFNGPGPILALTSGDYNGDGIADIGLVQQVVERITNKTFQSIEMLFGDAAHSAAGQPLTNVIHGVIRNEGTGYFTPNLATPGAASLIQFEIVKDQPGVILKSTAQDASSGIGSGIASGGGVGSLAHPELFLYGAQGTKAIEQIQATAPDPITHKPLSILLTDTPLDLGKVDTNRALATAAAKNVTLVDATLQDFVVTDLDSDGTVDLVALTLSPVQFLVTFRGDESTGILTLGKASNNPNTPIQPNDNDGVFLGILSNGTVLVSVDLHGNGQFNGFAYLEFGMISPFIQEFTLEPAMGSSIFYAGGTQTVMAPPMGPDNTLTLPTITEDKNIQGLDAFYAIAASAAGPHPTTGYGVISTDTSLIDDAYLFIFNDLSPLGPTAARFFTEYGFFVDAGNGGNATAGIGGAGGVIGAPTLTSTANGDLSGPIQIVFPASLDFIGHAVLFGGSGGSGFGGGGNGGSVEGATARYANGTMVLTSSVLLSAGNGGNSTAGNGGNGGGIDHVSIQSGAYFSAGNGGNGVNGGLGGSILGNGVTNSFDTSDAAASLTPAEALAIGFNGSVLDGVGLGAGNGGQGSVVGGQGGSITNWNSVFNQVIGGVGGSLYYASGTGGAAAAGSGGSGGVIANSSPNVNQNNLSGDLHLQTGGGGDGLTGGDGGSITTFVNQPTQGTAVPGLLSVIAGAGGIGISGNGGVGGSITGFSSSATGIVISLDGSLQGIGRVISGDGGASFGAVGGNGGTISNIATQTSSTPIVVAAGAGGIGLTTGGQGGAVVNSIINSAAQQFGKTLIVAGAGGDATSVLAQGIFVPGDGDTGDLAHVILAFGNSSPHAGDGGNISNITQPVSARDAVDMIAGNGGSTINAGSIVDQATGVGRGGSVTDVNLTGTVGALSRDGTLTPLPANPPIQAYATTDGSGITSTLSITAIIDLLAQSGTQVVTFTDNATIPSTALFDPTQINISGNVGIVAGQAGLVRGSQPPSNGVNGSVQNITAASVMSIVAGSVSAVAPVNILSGITVTDPDGVLGVDRTPVPLNNPNANPAGNGRLDYRNQFDQIVTNLQPGYSLVNADGALFAITIEQTVGTILRGPRVIPVTG